jgi:hypothetical protein
MLAVFFERGFDAEGYVWLRCVEVSALTKISGYASKHRETYSLCGSQISAFLGSIAVSA